MNIGHVQNISEYSIARVEMRSHHSLVEHVLVGSAQPNLHVLCLEPGLISTLRLWRHYVSVLSANGTASSIRWVSSSA